MNNYTRRTEMKNLYHEFRGIFKEYDLDSAYLEANVRVNCYYQTGLITLSQADAISEAFDLDYVTP